MNEPETVTVQTCNAVQKNISNQFTAAGIEMRDMKDSQKEAREDIKSINGRIFTIILLTALSILGILGNIAVTLASK